MNWLWKRLGYHVCEDFTQWQKYQDHVSLVPVINGFPIESMRHNVMREYQERTCKKCGKVQRRSLPSGVEI